MFLLHRRYENLTKLRLAAYYAILRLQSAGVGRISWSSTRLGRQLPIVAAFSGFVQVTYLAKDCDRCWGELGEIVDDMKKLLLVINVVVLEICRDDMNAVWRVVDDT